MAQCGDLSVETVPLQAIYQSANGNASLTSPTRPTGGDRPNKEPPKPHLSTVEQQKEHFSLGLS